MASEYLRKSVADRRTGANLIGIRVDTSNMNNIASDYSIAFKQLEAFAKETDELKIQNEKAKLKLDIENSRLKFRQDYLNNPAIYSSQEEWDKVSSLYEQEKQKAKQRIADSKYLTASERELYSKEIDNNFMAGWIEPYNKRNAVVAQERVSEATLLLETAINNACADDLYKTDTIDNFIDIANTAFSPLIKLGVQTENDRNYKIIQGISRIESERMKKKFENDILKNQSLTFEQKRTELNKVISLLNNPQRINEITENMTSEYGFNNYEKEYMKSILNIDYKNAEENLKEEIYKLETKYTKQEKEENEKIIKAYNEKNFYEYAKANNKTLAWDTLLSNEVKASITNDKKTSLVYQITGKTIFEINQNGEYIKNLIPTETMETWKKDIKTIMESGESKYSATAIVLAPVLANCDDDTAQAIINSLASESGDYRLKEYDYILKGIKNKNDIDFNNAKKINSLIEIGGKVSPSQMAVLKNVPVINELTQKIIEASDENIDYSTALNTVVSLGLGINARDGIVETTEIPEDFKQQADYIMHVFSDQEFLVLKRLNAEFGSNGMINTIAQMKSNKEILLPVDFRKGDK